MSGQMSTSSGCCGSKATTSMDEEGGSLVANQGDGGAEADALIASILDEVGLSAQKDTVVGGMFKRGLSGGQKRRLSVALEAITSPLNMFLDEPTSGLDSESALRLMQYLHRYARGIDPTTGERRRVIVTIHQPSSRIWELIGMCSILSFVAFLLLISIHGQFILQLTFLSRQCGFDGRGSIDLSGQKAADGGFLYSLWPSCASELQPC